MAIPTIVQTANTYFTSDFNRKAARKLGEKRKAISKALTAIIPVALAGILNQATKSKEGAEMIFERSKTGAQHFPVKHDMKKLNYEDATEDMGQIFFETNQPSINEAIAAFAEIKMNSTVALMAFALPAILALLGKHANRKNLSASGLTGYLSSQRKYIAYAMPEGIEALLPHFGLSVSYEVFHLSHEEERTKKMKFLIKWWLITFSLIIIIILILLFATL